MSNGTNFPNGLSVVNKAYNAVTTVVRKTKVLPIGFADGTTENDTGFDLPANGLLQDIWVNVKTAEATGTTKSISVGLLSSESGGDADGFIRVLNVASVGLVHPEIFVTTGLNETFYADRTYGALLLNFLAGTDAANDFGLASTLLPYSTATAIAKSITWTPASTDFAELAAEIVIVYDEITLS